jgi:WD40-like Beta Propeller Repeat
VGHRTKVRALSRWDHVQRRGNPWNNKSSRSAGLLNFGISENAVVGGTIKSHSKRGDLHNRPRDPLRRRCTVGRRGVVASRRVGIREAATFWVHLGKVLVVQLFRGKVIVSCTPVGLGIWTYGAQRLCTRESGRAVKLIASTRSEFQPQYSPDGSKIVFASDRTGPPEIWICNGDGSNPVQLTLLGVQIGLAPVVP